MAGNGGEGGLDMAGGAEALSRRGSAGAVGAGTFRPSVQRDDLPMAISEFSVPVPLPVDEGPRLARLRALAVLDTAPEPLFDALVQAAACVTGMPIALITLVDARRQWFKANLGLAGITETPRAGAFCAYAILGEELLEVPDAQRDERFAASPLVTEPPYLRFYAGAPITLRDGLRMGSLCVLDHVSRTLDAAQREALQALARAAAEALDLRMLANERESALVHETAAAQRRVEAGLRLTEMLRASEGLLERTGRLAGVGGWEIDLSTQRLTWSGETCRIHDLPSDYKPTVEEAIGFYAPEARPLVRAALEKSIAGGGDWDVELPLVTATGRKIWVRAVGAVEYAADGRPGHLVGALQDVTVRRQVVLALEASERRYRKLFQYSLGLICTHDHEGVLLSVNPAAARSLGYAVGELLGRSLRDFIRPEDHAAFRAYLLRIMTTDTDSGMFHLIAKDGSLRTWQYQNMLDDDSDEPYVLGHAQDFTEQYRQEQRLLELSTRDPLTGCFNRRFLAEVSEAGATDPWGCIAVDLDHFKQVNDTYGHQRGDEVLVAMAQFLSSHVRPGDAVVRLGGDEFLVLLRDADVPLTGQVVARIEEDRVAAPIAFTLGAATFGHGVSLDHGMAEADHQLYQVRARRPPTDVDVR
jgi:diguanylate cyclase (GGDEF)-like protein/PAS domain S-box-containing protein